MRLYNDERAPNPRRVRIFLAEKGIDIELVAVDLVAQEHKSVDFSNKNPFERVPVLELDDQTYISESVAICRYFEALQPEPPLFGVSPKEQAIVEMWNRRIELGLHAHIAQAFRHTNPAMAKAEAPQVKEWGEANAQKIDAALMKIDKRLCEASFIAGNKFSIADITLLVSLDFLRVLRRSIPENMEHLLKWYEHVKMRQSVKA